MIKRFDTQFTPFFTPREMLQLGVFDGQYFAGTSIAEYPRSWFPTISAIGATANLFGKSSGLTRQQWMDNGWIHKQDGLGWFQWYCRYYRGRRTADDARQIQRWRAYSRHSSQVAKNGHGQLTRLVQRQSLLHWAWNPFPDYLRSLVVEPRSRAATTRLILSNMLQAQL